MNQEYTWITKINKYLNQWNKLVTYKRRTFSGYQRGKRRKGGWMWNDKKTNWRCERCTRLSVAIRYCWRFGGRAAIGCTFGLMGSWHCVDAAKSWIWRMMNLLLPARIVILLRVGMIERLVAYAFFYENFIKQKLIKVPYDTSYCELFNFLVNRWMSPF